MADPRERQLERQLERSPIIAALRAEKGAAGSPSVDKEKLEAIRSAANTVLAAFGPVKPSGKLGEALTHLEETVRD